MKNKDKASPADRVSVIGYGEDEYQEYASYLAEGTLDVDENGIVFVQNIEATLQEEVDDESYDAIDLIASMVEYPATDYKLGDTIELKWGNEKKTYEIQGIVRIDKDTDAGICKMYCTADELFPDDRAWQIRFYGCEIQAPFGQHFHFADIEAGERAG